MPGFTRSFPRRWDDHPLPEPSASTPTFQRQVSSRPARVLLGGGDFAAQRRKLARHGPGARAYFAHNVGDGVWQLFEIPSGRELIVKLVPPPARPDRLETWLERTRRGWIGRFR